MSSVSEYVVIIRRHKATYTMRIIPSVATINGMAPTFNNTIAVMMRPRLDRSFSYAIVTAPPAKRTCGFVSNRSDVEIEDKDEYVLKLNGIIGHQAI